MRMLRVLRQRARSLFRRADVDAELDRELAFHLEQLARESRESGLDSRAAHLAARREMGGVAQFAEQCRDQRRTVWLVDLRKDVSYAWRMLARSPGFTTLSVVTLALGLGASVAVYALAESLILRSLPFPAPERLMAIYSVHVRRGQSESVGQEDFRDWQAANTVFERMAFTEFSQATLTGHGDAERIEGLAVSEGFFEMLGVQPQLGRWFTPEEQRPGAARVVMVSHRFWVSRLGARPDAVGSTLLANDRPYVITGVMPESFRLNRGTIPDYWTPIAYRNYGHQNHQYAGYGRLKPGVGLRTAQAQMNEIARRMERQFPDCAGWGIRVVSLRGVLLENFGAALAIFAGAALVVLLVACANVASLLLARGLGRSKEIAVRIAMGAGRARVIRLLLTESLLLAGMGTAGGMLLAWWLLRVAVVAAPPWLELGALISVSPTLAVFAVILALATGILTGLWPAVRGSRTSVQEDLKESGNSLVAVRRQTRALKGLVVVEIALAVLLLSFAGLLLKSFSSLLHTSLGFRSDHLLTFRLPLPSSRYRSDAARAQFWDKLLPQLAALPGVVSTAAADSIPMGGTYSSAPVAVEGQAARGDWADASVRGATVTPDYFRALGVPLLAGRGFTSGDTAQSEPVAIVNEAFVRRLMPAANPLGARVQFSGGKWQRIVGVVADSLYHGPTQPGEAELYTPFAQDPYVTFVLLRTANPEERVVGAARALIRGIDAGLPITQVRSMQRSVELSTMMPREMMALLLGFAAITLLMATLGLGGVMAYTVSRRRREIGLRMALGARRGDVSRAVIAGASRLVLVGAALGAAGALAAGRVLESQLYGVRPNDPLVIAAAPLVLAAAALLACLAPAHRAASVDPLAALRQE